MTLLLEPFSYGYMTNAIGVSALVGAVCAFLSAYLMLKGWSLIGDALSHSIVPCVAGAYMLGLPFAFGAFLSGGLAALAMLFLRSRSGLKEDAIIGLIFTSFFGLGLFMVSLNPMAVSIQTITMGNILAITPGDTLQLAIIGVADGAARQVARPDGSFLRRAPRPYHRPQPRVAVAVLAGLCGVYASFWIDSAPAPTIVLLLHRNLLLRRAHRPQREPTPAARARPRDHVDRTDTHLRSAVRLISPHISGAIADLLRKRMVWMPLP